MNVYRRIINEMGLSRDRQNYHGQLYLMFALLADMEAVNPAYQQLESLIGVRVQ